MTGFLRSLNRKLGLPMRLYGADLFDQARSLLVTHESEKGTDPMVLIDDAEGLTVAVIDALRRHSDQRMSEVYASIDPSEKQAALAKVVRMVGR